MPHTVAKRSPLIETRRLLHVITLDHVCICHSHSLCHALWFWMLLGTSSLIHKLMFQPLPPWFSFFSFSFPGTDESEEQNQTSCLVYLEERDKCGFRLFQGTHINHAWEGALGVGRSGGGGGAEGRRGRVGEVSVCRERTAFTHFKTCENVPFTPSAAAQPSSAAMLAVIKCLRAVA